MRALANAITPELRHSGVKVTLISPGFVTSEIRSIDNTGKHSPSAKEPIAAWLVMPTSKAVRQILRAIARGNREAIITAHGKVLVTLQRHAPWLLHAISRAMTAARRPNRTESKSL